MLHWSNSPGEQREGRWRFLIGQSPLSKPIITGTPLYRANMCQLHPTATSGLRFFWRIACGLIESLSHCSPWRRYSKQVGRLSTNTGQNVSECFRSKSLAQRIPPNDPVATCINASLLSPSNLVNKSSNIINWVQYGSKVVKLGDLIDHHFPHFRMMGIQGTLVTCSPASPSPSPRAEQRAPLSSPVTAGTTAVTMRARPLPPGWWESKEVWSCEVTYIDILQYECIWATLFCIHYERLWVA